MHPKYVSALIKVSNCLTEDKKIEKIEMRKRRTKKKILFLHSVLLYLALQDVSMH